MSRDFMNYNAMVEDALRGVVRAALARAAQSGLPGNHHFYITFRTDVPGVQIPDYLHGRYPEEMTIVLQHQFWGLEANADHFAVTLSFNRVSERLVIPYAALTTFADPSVQFGLQFKAGQAGATAGGPVPALAPAADKPAAEKPPEKKPGEVVALDTFRKK